MITPYELSLEEAITIFRNSSTFQSELKRLFPHLEEQGVEKPLADFAELFFTQLQQQEFKFFWTADPDSPAKLNPETQGPDVNVAAEYTSGFLHIQRKFSSPAKLNSFLNIMSKDQGNNYHNMLSFFQYIDLADEFTLSLDLCLNSYSNYWLPLNRKFSEEKCKSITDRLKVAYRIFLHRMQVNCRMRGVPKKENFIYRGIEGLIPLLLPLLLEQKIPPLVTNPNFSPVDDLYPEILKYKSVNITETWLKLELLFFRLFQLNITVDGKKKIPAQGGLAGGTVNGVAAFANFEKIFAIFLSTINICIKQGSVVQPVELKDSILASLTDIEQQDLFEPLVLKIWGADAYAFLQQEKQAFFAYRYGNRNLLGSAETERQDPAQYRKDLEGFYSLLSEHPYDLLSLDGRMRSDRKISQFYNQVELALGFALNHSPLHLLPYQQALLADLGIEHEHLAKMLFLFSHWGQMSAGLLRKFASKKPTNQSLNSPEVNQLSDYLLNFITGWFLSKPQSYFYDRLVAIRGLHTESDSTIEKRKSIIQHWYNYFLDTQQAQSLDYFGLSLELPLKEKLKASQVLFNAVKSLTLVANLLQANCNAIEHLKAEWRVDNFLLVCARLELLITDYEKLISKPVKLTKKAKLKLAEDLEYYMNSLLELVYEFNLFMSWFKYEPLVQYVLVLPKAKVSTKAAFNKLKEQLDFPEIPCELENIEQVNMTEIGQFAWNKPSHLLTQIANREVKIRYDNDFLSILDLRDLLNFSQVLWTKLPDRIRLTGSGSTMFVCRFGSEDPGFNLALENLKPLNVKVVPVAPLPEIDFN